MNYQSIKTVRGAMMALALALSLGFGTMAMAAEDFYEGKTIRVINTTSAGGTMDLYLLLLIKHMENHLPDSTNVVLEHRDGAGGLVGANYIFGAAPSDGTQFGMTTPYIAFDKFAQPNAARFEVDEFSVVGRMVDLPRVFVARADSGIETMEDVTGSSITHAILAAGTYTDLVTTAVNETMNAELRSIPGYGGGGPMFVAMEQGEVQSTTAEPGNLIVNKWHLVEDGTINVLSQLGLERTVGLEDVPLTLDFVDADHELFPHLEFLSSAAALGLPLLAPPGVPQDRLDYLREVVRNTMNDPALIAEAEERNLPINYGDADLVSRVLADAANAPEAVRQWVFEQAQAQ